MASPKITSIKWGNTSLSGELSAGKDYKLYPGGGRPWDWNETGTRHSPGIQVADVKELVENGAAEIVLSQGMQLQLKVQDETVRWLDDQGVKTHIAETRAAVEIYNQLVEAGVKVGGCFHSTC